MNVFHSELAVACCRAACRCEQPRAVASRVIGKLEDSAAAVTARKVWGGHVDGPGKVWGLLANLRFWTAAGRPRSVGLYTAPAAMGAWGVFFK